MQVVTANAACAIAYRNAVFRVIPSVYIDQIMVKIKQVALGDTSQVPERRNKAIAYFLGLGFTEREVLDMAGVIEAVDIGAEELLVLTNIKESIRSGEQTVHTLREDMKIQPNREDVSNAAMSNYGVVPEKHAKVEPVPMQPPVEDDLGYEEWDKANEEGSSDQPDLFKD